MKTSEIKGSPGQVVVLRTDITARVVTPVVVQARVEDWISEKGEIFPAKFQAHPSYLYLKTGVNAHLTLSLELPASAPSSVRLHSAFVLSGIEDVRVPLAVEILPESEISTTPKEIYLTLLYPPEVDTSQDDRHFSSDSLRLMSYFAGLEILPAKWVVAELILSMCARGSKLAKTEAGTNMLLRLSKTRFYKNASLLFRGAQTPNWVMLTYSISAGLNALTGNFQSEKGILAAWDEMFFNLLDKDIESPNFQHDSIHLSESMSLKAVIEEMGSDSQKWVDFFLLGLADTVPHIYQVLQQVIARIPAPPANFAGVPTPPPANVIDEDNSLLR